MKESVTNNKIKSNKKIKVNSIMTMKYFNVYFNRNLIFIST